MSSLSMDFFPVASGLLSSDNAAMLMGNEIIERTQDLAKARGVQIPRKPKDAFRKQGDRSTLPSLPTLIECAEALGTSIAYLVGETDDPTPSAPLRTSRHGVPMIAEQVNAAASTSDPDYLAVALSIETSEAGELGFLLNEDDAVLLRHRLHDAILEVGEVRRKRSKSSVAS